ncbi:MAG TPA: hypothetical protein VGD60_15875 [Candidatus Acidoferrales bacterium]
MSIAVPADLLPQNRRRSKRLRARVPICVRFQDAAKRFVSEQTHSIIINEHGALILLAAPVRLQQVIRVENVGTEKEVLCRVALLGPTFMGKTQVAVEFIMPMPGFWTVPKNSEPANSAPRNEKPVALKK